MALFNNQTRLFGFVRHLVVALVVVAVGLVVDNFGVEQVFLIHLQGGMGKRKRNNEKKRER